MMLRFRAQIIGSPDATDIRPKALNEHGAVTGAATDANRRGRAFVWSGNSFTFLPTLGGLTAIGYAINRYGMVAGSSQIQDGQERAFLYAAGRIRNLGTLGGNISIAVALNDRGVAAGAPRLPTTPFALSFIRQDSCARWAVWAGFIRMPLQSITQAILWALRAQIALLLRRPFCFSAVE